MKQTKVSGIYVLEWSNGYFYIGQSMNVKVRWSRHQTGFKTGHMAQHHPKLYNVWLKHGKPTFRVLEECSIRHLDGTEQRHIDAHWGNPLLCNTNPSASSSRGVKRTKPAWNKGVPMTAGHNQMLIAARGDQKGENHPTCKLTDKDVMEIRERYIPFKVTAQILAEAYGVTKESILRIVNNKTWTHLPSADIEKNKALVASEGAIEFNGESRNLRQWAKHLGVKYLFLYHRIHVYKWPVEKAFTSASRRNGQKLTDDQVREIRARYAPHAKANGSVQLGKEYGMSHEAILKVAKRLTYADVV